MKQIHPDVAKQLYINYFIAYLPLLVITGVVVASLSGLIFDSAVMFWLAFIITPLALNGVVSTIKAKKFCQTHKCVSVNCLAKQ